MCLERDTWHDATLGGGGWPFDRCGPYWACLMCGRREYLTPGETTAPKRRRDAGRRKVRVAA